MKVIIFTDGAARGNPDGPGGYGAIVRLQNAQGQTLEKELSGGYPHTTNNRMELMGVIAALEEIGRLGEPCEGVIYSDSRYVVDAFAKNWISNWQKNGWVTSSKAPVKNQDLWTRLLKALAPHRMTFRWVKGHADHPENERCDQLATAAADKVGWSFDDTAAPLTQASEWLSAGSAEAGQDTAAAAESVRTSSRLSGTSQTSRTEPVQTIRVRYLSDQIEKLQRSSTYKNFGIIQANHHGVVDNSYCGDGDLWRMPVIAMRDTHIHINDRICQFRIERRQPDLIFEEVEHLDSEDRGGFGSTGVR